MKLLKLQEKIQSWFDERLPGFHCEWNLGSPGGWYYQEVAQHLGHLAWERLRPHLGLPFDLNYRSPYFHPMRPFAEMLLRGHIARHGRETPPFIVLLAEIETLDQVVENQRLVQYLNSLAGIEAALAAPEHLTLYRGQVRLQGRGVTIIYMDFNNDTLLKMGEEININPVKAAIRQGLLINPRGMEPVGVKGVFEAITGPYRRRMSASTVRRTPWTRLFHPRRTTGPQGEKIADLLEWTRRHLPYLILKPAQGYSGQGIQVGFLVENPEAAIQAALAHGGYIVQSLVPLETWQEYYPGADPGAARVRLELRQTDFRCFITDRGLIGFLGRFGGIPTNVGSGGGTQSFALLKSDLHLQEADHLLNRALEKLPHRLFLEVQEEVNRRAMDLGFTYLLGTIPTSLKPRMLKWQHLAGLKHYAHFLWRDAQTLEHLWRQGKLEDVAPITPEEKALARLAPWEGRPALMVSDGLYNFRSAGF
jgi:hypothetical protein